VFHVRVCLNEFLIEVFLKQAATVRRCCFFATSNLAQNIN